MMDESVDLYVLYRLYQKYKRRRNRRWYIRRINERREERGDFHTLVTDMRLQDDEAHFQYFPMTRARFDDLLSLVGPLVTHPPTHRQPVKASERLTLRLRILATGESHQSIAHTYRLGKCTVRQIFHDTCQAIWTVLNPTFVKFPTSTAEWTNDFWLLWNFPNDKGAIDGKYVVIKAPRNVGRYFYNYKHCHSVILMAVVDARCRFIMGDVGAYGRESDGGAFSASEFGKKMIEGQYDYILTETKGQNQNVGVISLNRPAVRNALSEAVFDEICDAIHTYDKDPNIACLILAGKGKAFSAGADLKEMAGLQNFASVYMGGFTHQWKCVSACRKPIIAAVHTYALGGACELALMCDIIYASRNTRFGQLEIKYATMPGAGGTQRLCKALGKSRTMELVLTGNTISAEEAEQKGLVSRVVSEEDLMSESLKLAEQIGKFSKITVVMAKEAVNAAYEMNLQEGLQFERHLCNATYATADRLEGMTAFIEKRDANFQDK